MHTSFFLIHLSRWVVIGFVVLASATTPAIAAKVANNEDLFAVTFPTENDGWACGRWGAVLHTTDGGKTWGRQETRTDYTLSSIHFPDAKHGWAVGDGSTIIHTTDGGKTWKQQKSPVALILMGVQFVTPKKGWIVTERTHILSTDDGGSTWKVQFKEDDFILKALSFCDAFNGWAVGEYGFIYHTKDGGKTWTKQAGEFGMSKETGEVEAGPYLFSVVALDPQTAWAVGIDGYVTRTTDGGKTWTEVKTGAPKATLYGITTDKQNTLLVCGEGIFLSSPDRGKTWGLPKFDPPITYDWLYGLSRRGTAGFVAVGSGGAIYRNSSGNWSKVNY